MSKKILLVSMILLVLTVALTACKSKEPEKKEEISNTTDKVVETVTVTGKDGGVTVVEIYEDASGDLYITNIDGEKVDIGADEDGFYDDYKDLVTAKPSSAESSGTTTTNPSSTTTTTNASSSETATSGGLVIGSKVPQDSIDWKDV